MNQPPSLLAHWRSWTSHILRLGLGGLFILAAWPKIHDPAAFAQMIYYYKILPDALINPVALLLPWTELVCGISLIAIPRLRPGAAALITLMLIVFTTAIIFNLARGLDISCGCFSVEENAATIGWPKVVENLALIGLGGLCMRLSAK
ncbi:MAG: DoxX family membrane protein [Verrucomicrobia bacterium]|nr:DoxX family membrane protein [Kiritimatiellia bacterium]MCB1102377.1 DoxX family membrane protein [Kiritimatiellia bacterium]MCP5487031.1 DoxX family membrane protein [Verrucomicrobiota bacterium]